VTEREGYRARQAAWNASANKAGRVVAPERQSRHHDARDQFRRVEVPGTGGVRKSASRDVARERVAAIG
jgi:hypothetical protein